MDTRLQHQKSVYTKITLFSLLSATVGYLHGSYLLAQGLTQSQIDIMYILLSICGIAGIWILALKKQNLLSLTRISTLFAFVTCLCLAVVHITSSPLFLMFAFFVYLGIESPLFFTFDELLEASTDNAKTGQARSLFLTFQNVCWIIAPLIGFILIEYFTDLQKAYTISLFVGLVLLFYSLSFTPSFALTKDTRATESKPFNFSTLPAIFSHLVLQLFFAGMVALMPIYMHQVLGWSWITVGVIIACAITAFPLVQIPLGRQLDVRKQEDILVPLGFLVIGLALYTFVLTKSAGSIVLTAAMFFLTRVGAATVEMCNQFYVFRHIDYHHRSNIALFRSLSPLSYLAVPVFWLVSNRFGFETLFTYMAGGLIVASVVFAVIFHIYRK